LQEFLKINQPGAIRVGLLHHLLGESHDLITPHGARSNGAKEDLELWFRDTATVVVVHHQEGRMETLFVRGREQEGHTRESLLEVDCPTAV